MIVLDTTVLAYAVGDEHPFREPCLRLLDLVRAQVVGATTTVQVLQEFAHVRARRRSRSDAASLARDMAGLLAPLLSPALSELLAGLDLFESHPGMGSFDSVLAATCINRSQPLVSADRAFASVPSLAHVAPGTPQFEELLG